MRLRPRRHPPQESGDRNGAAVQKSVRRRIRQRRLYRRHGSWRSNSATGPASRNAAPRRESAADIAASGSAITSISRPAYRARRPRSRCRPTVSSSSSSASCRRARATRRALRNSSPNGSACRSSACASSRATPIASPSAAARIPAAACGSARSSSKNRPTALSKKACASPSSFSKLPSPTSNSRTVSSR